MNIEDDAMIETFFDSQYQSQYHSFQDETFTINFDLWNGKPAKIIFEDVIGFCVLSIHDPIGLRYEASPSDFFQNALSCCFENIPEHHDYKSYEIVDVNETPFIKIIAKRYKFLE